MRSATVFFTAAATIALASGPAATPLWSAGRTDYCSQTADLLFRACGAMVTDDTLVGQAICLNVSDSVERVQCVADLNDSTDEANLLCQGQHDTRLQACGLLGQARYDPDLDPGQFDDPKHPSHPNPFFPLKVGYKWVYVGEGQVDTVEIVNETKLIDDIGCIVARDVVREDGVPVEATDDWYASAKDGTAWYFGEQTEELETFDGDNPMKPELVNIDGSFKAGRDGDKGGIIFLPSPKVGDVYLEEYSLANAEDVTQVLSTTYAYGHDPELDQYVPQALADRFCSGDCVVTKNFSLLEPGIFARKYYARGIGVFLEVEVNAGAAVQLVSCNFDNRCKNLPRP